MTAPLIHIGYHKTGTSWLQRELFPRADLGYRPVSISVADTDFVHVNDLDFDPARYRADYAPVLAAAAAGGGVPVISHERLSGNPHSGGYDSMRLAQRLHDVFPDARVMLVIREQRAMILSSYAQYVRVGGGCTLDDYLFPANATRQPMFSFDHFKYHRLIECYRRLFGADRVLVLPFEQLRADPRGFVRAVAAFSGGRADDELPFDRSVNKSLGAVALIAKRRINPFFVRDSVNGNGPFAVPRAGRVANAVAELVDRAAPRAWDRAVQARWKARIAEVAAGRYDASNAETAALTRLDLAGFGYPLGANGA